jgi:hypothetical protein
MLEVSESNFVEANIIEDFTVNIEREKKMLKKEV